MSMMNLSIEIPDAAAQAQIEEFDKARQALRERLVDQHHSEWQLSSDDVALLLTTLTMQRISPEAMAEFNRVIGRLGEAEKLYAKVSRRLSFANRLMFWTALFVSAMFAAAYAAGGELVCLLQAIVWGANFLAQLWLHWRTSSPPQGAKP